MANTSSDPSSRAISGTLRTILAQFQPVGTIEDEDAKDRRAALAHAEELRNAEIEDIKGRLRHRKIFVYGMLFLLLLQNAAAFWLIWAALCKGELKDLQTVFSVYTGATLTETALVVRSIVKSVFGEIPYPHRTGKSRQDSSK